MFQIPRYVDLETAVHGTAAPQEIIDRLELVPVDYLDFNNEKQIGQLVVAKVLSAEIQDIFGRIRDAQFPIWAVIPAVFFNHDKDKLVPANITSAFNHRHVEGTDRLSRHSYGRAIDINPWQNPYLNLDGSLVTPRLGKRFYDPARKGTITFDGPVVRAFTEHGWDWGGRWSDGRDYQHFDKQVAG